MNECQRRRAVGWLAISGSVGLTLLVGLKAHWDTQAISKRQQVVMALWHSDIYPLCIMDEHGQVTEWNRGMEELTGVSHADAVEGGFQQIICDPVKLQSHKDGVVRAFGDPSVWGKLTLVNCDIQNTDGTVIPVRIAVRIVEAGDERFAIARMDREKNIVEFGQRAAERGLRERAAEHP